MSQATHSRGEIVRRLQKEGVRKREIERIFYMSSDGYAYGLIYFDDNTA